MQFVTIPSQQIWIPFHLIASKRLCLLTLVFPTIVLTCSQLPTSLHQQSPDHVSICCLTILPNHPIFWRQNFFTGSTPAKSSVDTASMKNRHSLLSARLAIPRSRWAEPGPIQLFASMSGRANPWSMLRSPAPSRRSKGAISFHLTMMQWVYFLAWCCIVFIHSIHAQNSLTDNVSP